MPSSSPIRTIVATGLVAVLAALAAAGPAPADVRHAGDAESRERTAQAIERFAATRATNSRQRAALERQAREAASTMPPAGAALGVDPPEPTSPTMARANEIMNLDYQAWDALSGPDEPPFNWSNDGCSTPIPTGYNDLFRPACEIHDFGYRNYGWDLELSVKEDTRVWIDDRLLQEMRRICNDLVLWQRPGCHLAAEQFHLGVRVGGWDAFYNG